MISQLSDNMPLATLLAYLADAPVIETDSSEDQTTYRFQCGCVALRIPDEDVVRVVWCSLAPTGQPRGIIAGGGRRTSRL